ncbi:MAG: TRAP transporter small permease subunit [Methylococcales bacterium]|nr:TRAP transporter small permease subunit [Methylococcales bacterium]
MTANKQGMLARLLRITHILEDSFLIMLLSSMIILAVTQIVLRNFFDSGLQWIDPLLRLLVLWVGMAGAMVATREDHHISMDVFTRTMSIRVQQIVRVFTDVFTCLVAAIIAYHAVRLVLMDREAESIAFASIPSWVCELILPLAFGVIALRYFIFAVTHAGQLLAMKEN